MPTIIDRLLIEIGFDTKGLETGRKQLGDELKQVRDQADKTGKDMEAAGKRASSFFETATAAGLSLLSTLGAIGLAINTVAQSIQLTAVTAQAIGMDPREFQAVADTLHVVGASIEATKSAMAGLAGQMQHFRLTGEIGKEMQSAMLAAKIDPYKDDPKAALDKFIHYMNTTSNPDFIVRQQAHALFGSVGDQVFAMGKKGEKAYKDMYAESEKGIIHQDAIDRIDHLAEGINRLLTNIINLQEHLLGAFAWFAPILDGFNAAIEGGGDFSVAMMAIVDVIGTVLTARGLFKLAGKLLGKGAPVALAEAGGVAAGGAAVGEAAVAGTAVEAGLAMGPPGWIALALAAVGLAGFGAYEEFKDTSWWKKNMPTWMGGADGTKEGGGGDQNPDDKCCDVPIQIDPKSQQGIADRIKDALAEWLDPNWDANHPEGGGGGGDGHGPSGGHRTNDTTGPLPPAGRIGTTGDELSRENDIVKGLMARGLSQQSAEAVAARAKLESHAMWNTAPGDPSIPGGSHGLLQWNRERLEEFKRMNGGKLPEQTSLAAQLDFVMHERGGTAEGGHWQKIDAAGSVEEAAKLVSMLYIRPLNKLQEAANTAEQATRLHAYRNQLTDPSFKSADASVDKSTTLNTGDVHIHTPATDTAGLTKDFHKELARHLVAHTNDGLN